MWYVINRKGEQLGPLHEVDLAASTRAGTYDIQTMVWREGWPSWVPLGKTELQKYTVTSSNSPVPIPPQKTGLRNFFIGTVVVVAGFLWLMKVAHDAVQTTDPDWSPSGSTEECDLGFFHSDVQISGDVATDREIINSLNSSELLAGKLLQEGWDIAQSCTKLKTLKVTLIASELVDRYGNKAPDVIAVVSLDLEEARKYKEDYLYSQDDIVKGLMTVQIQRSDVGRFMND